MPAEMLRWMEKVKTLLECVKEGMELNLKPEMAQDRAQWRECIRGTRPTPVGREKRTLRRR